MGDGDPLEVGHKELELIETFSELDRLSVVDVGCGIGRLTQYLVHEPIGHYLGLDIIPEILEQAVATAGDDRRFRFEISVECQIPEPGESVDMVVGFSLITHLMDEEVFECIQEAYRVLHPGGIAIFSFMDFNLPVHQASFFSHSRYHRQGHGDILKFTTKDVLTLFGTQVGFDDVSFIDGSADLPRSGKPSPIFDISGLPPTYQFGQSVCVLRKPKTSTQAGPSAAAGTR
ncbi:class I SAM-dependent methyltransferase [Jatrophihabitans sp. GAS493]|uniref:class I SAM-dependent methyltransferase n=1 Tax=Jatrophihabitans sp. GAS493 TaxID=1907575 RepID=UPI0012FD70A9|nr:class I SAM-dependent methyltransferase [Jatrophihabitans sp. GAS493]